MTNNKYIYPLLTKHFNKIKFDISTNKLYLGKLNDENNATTQHQSNSILTQCFYASRFFYDNSRA